MLQNNSFLFSSFLPPFYHFANYLLIFRLINFDHMVIIVILRYPTIMFNIQMYTRIYESKYVYQQIYINDHVYWKTCNCLSIFIYFKFYFLFPPSLLRHSSLPLQHHSSIVKKFKYKGVLKCHTFIGKYIALLIII